MSTRMTPSGEVLVCAIAVTVVSRKQAVQIFSVIVCSLLLFQVEKRRNNALRDSTAKFVQTIESQQIGCYKPLSFMSVALLAYFHSQQICHPSLAVATPQRLRLRTTPPIFGQGREQSQNFSSYVSNMLCGIVEGSVLIDSALRVNQFPPTLAANNAARMGHPNAMFKGRINKNQPVSRKRIVKCGEQR